MDLTCKTTREHFEKYCAMRSKMGVSFLNSELFGTKLSLISLFKKDPTLSQIPLKMYAPYYEAYTERFPDISLEDAVNVIKHSLIYQVIGAKPEFIC